MGGNDSGDDVLNFSCPEAARLDCCRDYYMIYPPNTLMLGDGADCDWPGPEYETVTHSAQDERHHHSGPRDWRYYLDENPYW